MANIKIYLADLVHNGTLGDNQISGDNDYVVPLNVASVAEYSETILGSLVDITLFKYLDDLIVALKKEVPDILGLSNYVWNVNINEKAIKFAKGLDPKLVVIMGGPAISVDPIDIEKFLRAKNGLDAHIILEGERPFVELVKAVSQGGGAFLEGGYDIPGCAYLVNDKLVYSKLAQDSSIEEYSSPYLSGKLDEFLAVGLIPLFETNRGCPFKCTFCAWGISALNKVRKFTLDRVYAEMEYVAKMFPELPAWIVADANFGMLKRDIEIAQKLKDIKSRNSALRNIILWESKNTSERNVEIARIIGSDLSRVLVAVQTLDKQAQKDVKRDNINLDDVPRKIKLFHSSGVLVETHVLSGLPGESYQGHLETLRKCFDLGFDIITISSTLLVKGSEMESPEYQEKYKIGTKYRLREGSYGEYHGIKSIECEQIIRSNSMISEEEMLAIRPVHCLVWYGWNHGFLKPILRFLHQEFELNPLDVILWMVEGNKDNHPKVKKIFDDLSARANLEWFDSREDFENHYLARENWHDLIENGFSKAEFYFNARMILNRSEFDALLAYLIDLVEPYVSSNALEEVAGIMQAVRVEPEEIMASDIPLERRFTVPEEIARYFFDVTGENKIETVGPVEIYLRKPLTEQQVIRVSLSKFGFHRDRLYAVRKTLGTLPNAFVYGVSPARERKAPSSAEVKWASSARSSSGDNSPRNVA